MPRLAIVVACIGCSSAAVVPDGSTSTPDARDLRDAPPIVAQDAHVPVGPMAPMPRVSDELPAFASSGDPARAHDGNRQSVWGSDGTLPAWLAYDVSGLAQRGVVVVSWTNFWAASFWNDPVPTDGVTLPDDYTIDANHGPGGGNPPA